jgi:hypothetical protein
VRGSQLTPAHLWCLREAIVGEGVHSKDAEEKQERSRRSPRRYEASHGVLDAGSLDRQDARLEGSLRLAQTRPQMRQYRFIAAHVLHGSTFEL